MGRNLQLSRPTTPYGLICAPPLIGHRAQNEDLFVSSPWWPAPAPGIVAGARRCQARSCPRPRRGLGRGCSLTPVPLRLVRRLSGAGGDVSGRWLVVAVLELAVAREWLVRR